MKMRFFTVFPGVFLAVLLLLGAALPARAQDQKQPPLPPPMKTMVEEGAQIRYLGRHNRLDGWISMQKGQEQYFYVTEDGQSILMGLLFDADGKLITVRQVRALQEQSGDTLELLRQPVPEELGTARPD